MKLDGDGNLKRFRGKTLPIKVLPTTCWKAYNFGKGSEKAREPRQEYSW